MLGKKKVKNVSQGFVMGFAELQVAVLEISLREGAQLCSKSAERPGLWQPSLSELAECRQLEKAPLL